MAPESVRVQPGADSLLNGLSPRGPASGGQAPLGETPPAVAFTEAERPVSGSDSNSAQPSTERSPRPGFDWDAATAAALDADSNASAAVAEHHPAAPDRLLEDLIREIVGDATADTASALHPTRPTPERTIPASTASATGSAEAPLSIQADPSPSPAASPVATQPAESFAPHAPEQADLNAATSTPPAPIAVPERKAPGPIFVPSTPATPSSSPTPPQVPTEAPDVSRETSSDHGGTPLAYELADETRRRIALDEAVLPLPPSTRVLTISNQKGGVGKTTTAVNLAAGLARAGARVLVIDLDPQGNASTALGVDHRSERKSVYEVLVADASLAEVVQPSTEHELLDCVPATIHLAGAEIELVSLVAREQRLRRALDSHLASMERPYDYVFIDCPPSLGLLTINAFVAAREVLIPIQCEYYALEGLSQLLSNIELIEKHLNPELRLSTILLTMYDSRTNLAQQVAQEVRDHFPEQTLATIIPRSVRVSEAPSYGQSVISYDFGSSGSLSYREAAAEIARRGAAKPEESH